MVVVEIDASFIDVKTMKNRTEDEMIRAYQLLLKRITYTGVCSPKTHIFDNEVSDEFKIIVKTVKVATGSTRHSSDKYFRKGNSDIQESSHCNYFGCRPNILNALLVYITPTDIPCLEFGKDISYCTKSISTRIFTWMF